MRILAIETSCDDTGIAVLEVKGKRLKVLANVVSSQPIHQNYGGVFPMMAKREHQRNLIPVFEKALQESGLLKAQNAELKSQNHNSKLKTIEEILERESELSQQLIPFLENYEKPDVDMIAVTHGPGLEPCLWVGVNFAKALSYVWGIPIVPVNHIEAHILVNFLDDKKVAFPAIALVVSGGHTQLILMKGIGKYNIIGETRDDAAGECFDKAAKILGLGYPGGPIISKIASEARESNIVLPRPMVNTKDYDFSFSGLKTAVLYKTRESEVNEQFVKEMCVEVQQAIIDVLLKKTLQAAKDFKAKTIMLGGGVSANQELRKQLKEKIEQEIPDTQYLIPDTSLSTDNGLMIAVAGYFNRTKKITWQKLSANANLRVGK
jgi:N6-L-threonylcarbamoyladenine synthase